MISVTVSSKELQTFISSILNVDRSGVSLKFFPSFIEALVLSEDNSSVILYTKLNVLEISGLVGEEQVIHIKDLTKMQKLLDMNNDETFTFSIRDNHVYFDSDTVKGAKFMLADRPSKTVNARVNVQWFNSFEKTSRMKISKSVIKNIIQCSSFTSTDANKVYVFEDTITKYREALNGEEAKYVFDKSNGKYRLPKIETPTFIFVKPHFRKVEDGEGGSHLFDEVEKIFREPTSNEVATHVFVDGFYREAENYENADFFYDRIKGEYRKPNPPEVATHISYETKGVVAEINDRTKNNLDTLSIVVGELEYGKLEGKVIINVGTLSRLFLADEMILETSTIGNGVSQTEIVFLSFTNDNVSVRYLLNTLRS